MSTSPIEWTEHTWNPIVGCSIVSPGCTNCYAMKMARRIDAMGVVNHYNGCTKVVNGNAVWTGKLARASDDILLQPLRRKKPTIYFVNSMGDLFHEDVPDEWIDKVFAVMALCPQHTFQVLTKRSERMRRWFDGDRADSVGLAMLTIVERIPHGHRRVPWPLRNVWLGVSTERQQEADERIPHLLQTPAAVRFVSAEPLLGPIDLRVPEIDLGIGKFGCHPDLDWVIVGGESGPKARPMHVGWARDLRDQCDAAGVKFFFKQHGEWHPRTSDGVGIAKHCIAINGAVSSGDKLEGGGNRPRWIAIERVGKKAAGRLLDNREHNDMPERTA
jgi:protein gp37